MAAVDISFHLILACLFFPQQETIFVSKQWHTSSFEEPLNIRYMM